MTNFGSLLGAFVAGCAVTWSSTLFTQVSRPQATEAHRRSQHVQTPPAAIRPEPTPNPTPFMRPATSAEITAHQTALEAVRSSRAKPDGTAECDFPPSLKPNRQVSAPLTDAFGLSLNLESVMRPWSKGAPATVSFGPRAAIELAREPSSSDFLTYYAHLGQPFVIRGCAACCGWAHEACTC